MKSSKGDYGNTQSKSKASSAVMEAEPLFPRLHVNQTDKGGPRAPPRNKMALYEQFTIPCHQFTTSNRTVTYQQQYGQYPYGSCYVPSVTPYGGAGFDVCGHTLHGGSGTGGESAEFHIQEPKWASQRQTESVIQTQKPASLKDVTRELMPNRRCASEDALKDATHFDEVHTLGESSNQETGNYGRQDVMGSTVGLKTANSACKRHDFSDDMEVECSAVEDEDGCFGQGTLVDNTRAQNKLEVSKMGHVKGQCSRKMLSRELYWHAKTNCKEQLSMSGVKAPVVEAVSVLENNHSAQSKGSGMVIQDNVVALQSSNHPRNFVLLREESTSSANGDLVSKILPHLESGKLSHASCEKDEILETPIRPKDVIRAMGQKDFWRVRKEILRQQHIFSDQVFELHRLLKVQHLLAGSPSSLMDQDKNIEEAAAGYEGNDEDDGQLDEMKSSEPLLKESVQGQRGDQPGGQFRNQLPNADSTRQYLSSACYPGGLSAWGFPCSSMAGKSLFVYPPYKFGMGFELPVYPQSQVECVGFPISCKRHEESPLSYVFPAFWGHQWHAPDLMQGCYSMQDNNQRRLISGGTASCPLSRSSSSISKQPQFSACNAQYQRGLGNAPPQSHTDGSKNTSDQIEESSPSEHARTDTNTTPSSASSRKSSSGVVKWQDLNVQHGIRMNGKFDFEVEVMRPMENMPVEQKEGDKVQARLENSDKQVMEVDHSLDHHWNALNLFPFVPWTCFDAQSKDRLGKEWEGQAIKVTPRPAVAASESTAEILYCLQQERRH